MNAPGLNAKVASLNFRDLARRMKAQAPGTSIYLAVHCGREYLRSAEKSFCPMCGQEMRGDLYDPDAPSAADLDHIAANPADYQVGIDLARPGSECTVLVESDGDVHQVLARVASKKGFE